MYDFNTEPVHMRTIPQAYKVIREADPDCCISIRALRKFVADGNVPTVKIGGRVYVNLDLLLSKISCYNMDAVCACASQHQKERYKT